MEPIWPSLSFTDLLALQLSVLPVRSVVCTRLSYGHHVFIYASAFVLLVGSVGMVHSTCSPSGECECAWQYLPPHCDRPLYAGLVALYYAFVGIVAVVHGFLVR